MKNKIFLGAILSSFCALAFYMTSINHMKTQTLEIYGNSTGETLSTSPRMSGDPSPDVPGAWSPGLAAAPPLTSPSCSAPPIGALVAGALAAGAFPAAPPPLPAPKRTSP